MARDPAAAGRPFLFAPHPWALVLTGLGLVLLSYLLGAAAPDSVPALRVLLDFGGLAIGLTGVGRQLREGHWSFSDRLETAAMIATTGMASLAAWYGMAEDWVSGKIFFGGVFVASLIGVVTVVLPPVLRKVFLSLVLIFHFGGMLTAVTSVDPPNSTGPWVSKQLWTHVYRPYLTFLYLTNAYHFYSPDPGPPALFWYSVQYEDRSRTWMRQPEHTSSPVAMHYQRLLALPEHSYTPMGRLPLNNAEIALARQAQPNFRVERGSWEEIMRRREIGSTWLYPAEVESDGKKVTKALPIPLVWGMADYLQYREPQENSKRILASVAGRMVKTAPRKFDENGREVKVKSVKLYRVVHQVIQPQELAKGGDPWDKTRHWGYFLGEYNEEGKLLDPVDPFLYWYVPVLNVPRNYLTDRHLQAPNLAFGLPANDNTFVLDGLEMHAAGPVKK
jgi:hypothetical protein